MNINLELEQIIEESGILFEKSCFGNILKNKMKAIIRAFMDNKDTVFIGSKEEVTFVKELIPEPLLHCEVFEAMAAEELKSDQRLLVVDAGKLSNMECTRQQICILEEELKKSGYLMVYGGKGIHIKQELESYRPHPYEEIQILKIELESEQDLLQQDRILQNLIYIYLIIKDFQNVSFYIDEYIRLGFDKHQKYLHLQQNLLEFLQKIQNYLTKRKHNDIILFWVDALELAELEHTEFLKKDAEESLFFERAYTYTPFTSATVKIMFDKLRQIEENGFENANFKASKSALYQCIQKYGYDFNYFGLKGIADKLDIIDFIGGEDFAPGMIHMWNAMNYIINSDAPVFVMIHQFVETHMPWLSPQGKEPLIWTSAFCSDGDCQREQSQRRASLLYLDHQLQFYSQFFNYPCTRIIFSDHGSEREIRYNERNLNTLLYVKGSNFKPGICRRIISNFQFTELIEYVCAPSEEHFERIFTEKNIALFQDADVYNELGVRYYLEHGIEQLGMAFRGAVGDKDKYILRGDGKEFYYILPDEKTNYIGKKEYSKRIAELREAAGDVFVNIDQEEKFVNSRQLYK